MALNPDLSPLGAVPMAGEGEGMGGAGVVPKKMESKEGKEAQRAEKTDKGAEQPEVTNGWPFQGRASFSGMPSLNAPLNNPHSRFLPKRGAKDYLLFQLKTLPITIRLAYSTYKELGYAMYMT